LAVNYAGDGEVAEKLEDIAKNSHDPTGPMIALCRAWPSSPVINKIWIERTGVPKSAQPATAWLVSVKADLPEFFEYLKNLPSRIPNELWWRFPRETVRAVRNRLVSDPEAQNGLLNYFATTRDADVLASIARLSGSVVQDRKALRKWASGHLKAVKGTAALKTTGFDLFSGTPRPVEFCLLEACLTTNQ
jgi:hypothetical protein